MKVLGLRGTVLLAVLLWATAAAPAEESPNAQALRGCAELDDARPRLRCYDIVNERAPDVEEEASENRTVDVEASSAPAPSPLARRWELTARTERGPFVITPYKPTYLLPISYNASPNNAPYQEADPSYGDLRRTEVQFQLSFKTKIWPELLTSRGDLWFGYTQKSYWQGFKDSSPFRETNYEPELIYGYRTDFPLLGLNGRLLTVGLNHQSNGQGEPLSRSWNRVTAGALFDHGPWALQARAWWRIPESDASDGNPQITDTVGRGELRGFWLRGDHVLSVMVRSNFTPSRPKGAIQVDYSIPLGGAVKGYVQAFHGYGDSLIDYDHIGSRLSIGIMLTDWL